MVESQQIIDPEALIADLKGIKEELEQLILKSKGKKQWEEEKTGTYTS